MSDLPHSIPCMDDDAKWCNKKNTMLTYGPTRRRPETKLVWMMMLSGVIKRTQCLLMDQLDVGLRQGLYG